MKICKECKGEGGFWKPADDGATRFVPCSACGNRGADETFDPGPEHAREGATRPATARSNRATPPASNTRTNAAETIQAPAGATATPKAANRRHKRTRKRPGTPQSDENTVRKALALAEAGSATLTPSALAAATQIPKGSINAVCTRLENRGELRNEGGHRILTDAGRRANAAAGQTPGAPPRAATPAPSTEPGQTRQASAATGTAAKPTPGEDTPRARAEAHKTRSTTTRERALLLYAKHGETIEAIEELEPEAQRTAAELVQLIAAIERMPPGTSHVVRGFAEIARKAARRALPLQS